VTEEGYVQSKMVLTMQITQSLHTAILVTDLERSEHFYGKVLGLSKIDRSLKYPGVWYQVGDYQIHLIVATTVPTDNPNDKWGRNPHVAFSVADLDAAKQELLNQNYSIQTSASGRAALFTQDPDGNIIELSQQ
jgi:glyoxylase I family protein